MSPKSVNILKKLASIYILTGQISKAKEIYERIIKHGGTDFMPYYELAMLCIKTGDTDRAENMLKKVCKLKPDFAKAHKDLAVIYLNKRLFDYAKDEFEKAYDIASDDFSIVIEYANYFHATSDFEKADEMYQKALELRPEDANALAFSALNKTHLKQIDVALEQIKSAISKSPASAFMFFIAGRIYFLSNDFDCAKDYLIKSFEMEQMPETQNLLALCYFNLKDFKQAKIIFNNMLEKSPLNINMLLNTAKCYIELKETDKALEYLDKITETFPECEEAQELIREIS
jgi:tetratricopeptide (TPR) repeat protein